MLLVSGFVLVAAVAGGLGGQRDAVKRPAGGKSVVIARACLDSHLIARLRDGGCQHIDDAVQGVGPEYHCGGPFQNLDFTRLQ